MIPDPGSGSGCSGDHQRRTTNHTTATYIIVSGERKAISLMNGTDVSEPIRRHQHADTDADVVSPSLSLISPALYQRASHGKRQRGNWMSTSTERAAAVESLVCGDAR